MRRMSATRQTYRNTNSFAVHKLSVRAYGTLGPTDGGDIKQGPALRVFPAVYDAIRYADQLRQEHGEDETTGFSVIARWHDERGKVVDRDDVYIG